MHWWKHSTIRIRPCTINGSLRPNMVPVLGRASRIWPGLAAWLTEHGFTVNEIAVNHRQIAFSGNAGQVEDTFHTQIHRFLVGGENHIANTQDPQIPSAMAGVVSGILSLHNFRHDSDIQSRVSLEVRPRYTSGNTHYLFPADWAAIYDLNPLYHAGTNGAGTSIAIVGRSNINVADISAFRAASGLPARNPTVILVSTNPGLVSGDQDESTLDVEWAGAVAPSATVKFVVGASTSTTDGIDLSAQYVVNHATATVMSTSYGSCEVDMGAAELSFYNSLWQQAASEGISSFVSSGDAGAAGCYGGSSSSASSTGVNGLCSSPYSTCVGGTEFNEGSNSTAYWAANNGAGSGSALSYIPEEVWNESATKGGSGLWASGGGTSLYFSQPAWQRGVSGMAAANGMRAVPDVAASASAHDGYIIIENGNYYVISGTSAASPSFAGVMALAVQSKGGVGQGNANPSLYALLNASKNPFHATPSGNNNVPGVTGFTASGAAYNLATGLGSVDGSLLVSEWGSGSSPTNPKIDFVLTPSANQGTLLPGRTTSFTLSVTESGPTKNKVSLTATAAAGLTGSISPAIDRARHNSHGDDYGSFDHCSRSKEHCHHRYRRHRYADRDLHAHGDATAYSGAECGIYISCSGAGRFQYRRARRTHGRILHRHDRLFCHGVARRRHGEMVG